MTTSARDAHYHRRGSIIRRPRGTNARGLVKVAKAFSAIALMVIGCAMVAAANGSEKSSQRVIAALFCNSMITSYVDAGTVPMIEKAALRGRTFTAWVNYPSGAPRWTLGYRLDDGPTAGVLPLRDQQDEIVALSFPTLPTGMHRLRVGLLDPTQTLSEDNAYCFRVPGYVKWRPRTAHAP